MKQTENPFQHALSRNKRRDDPNIGKEQASKSNTVNEGIDFHFRFAYYSCEIGIFLLNFIHTIQI